MPNVFEYTSPLEEDLSCKDITSMDADGNSLWTTILAVIRNLRNLTSVWLEW